jgi:two-component system NtrC family sensor kinase/two-component system sensor histidine kinase AtoS
MASELEKLISGMDEESLLQIIPDMIKHMATVEQEHQELRETFNLLNQTFEDVIQSQSNALWILDKNNNIHLQNSKAQKLGELFKALHLDEREYEFVLGEKSYLVKINHTGERTIVSATNITEQKRKESLATMGQMAAHLSHEIRNPIGSIALLTSSLLKRVKVENKPIVFEVQKAIFRIERIIRATLMFSKGVAATKERVALDIIESELENAISYYSYSKDIAFNFSFPSVDVEADIELLIMVFSNFVFNAIDAIEADEETEEGEVSINYVKEDDKHLFIITDNGVPFENPDELFEAFKSTKEKGNGLGLVLSKQIISCHNGDIGLHEGERKGFEIRLPV